MLEWRHKPDLLQPVELILSTRFVIIYTFSYVPASISLLLVGKRDLSDRHDIRFAFRATWNSWKSTWPPVHISRLATTTPLPLAPPLPHFVWSLSRDSRAGSTQVTRDPNSHSSGNQHQSPSLYAIRTFSHATFVCSVLCFLVCVSVH